MARVLIAGCGYVGSKLARRLRASGHDVFGLKRRPTRIDDVEIIAADLNQPLESKLPDVDAAFFTAAPDSRDEAAYRSVYIDGLRHLKGALADEARLVFTSSTAVYGQDDGAEVNETSPTRPTSFRGEVLLEAEAMADVSLRLGGIYGPGRARLLDRVRSGEASYRPGRFLNLIHRDDACGALAHVMFLERPERTYIGVDEEPVESGVLYRWLADKENLPVPGEEPEGRGLNKRCSSQRLRSSGYRFVYPTFRDGYGELLKRKVFEPCPHSPNCVSSRASDARHGMTPLRFECSLSEARSAVGEALEAEGGRIVVIDDDYVRAEFTSRVFGFVDDVELALDVSTKRIDFRSASRVGYSDLGVNRRRMQRLVNRLEKDRIFFTRASD